MLMKTRRGVFRPASFFASLQSQGCGKIKFQGGNYRYDYQSQHFCVERTSSTWC